MAEAALAVIPSEVYAIGGLTMGADPVAFGCGVDLGHAERRSRLTMGADPVAFGCEGG